MHLLSFLFFSASLAGCCWLIVSLLVEDADAIATALSGRPVERAAMSRRRVRPVAVSRSPRLRPAPQPLRAVA